ncbi:tRNA-uridine aminocarboxypropyltransferase [Rugamonas sp. CCM 8940]|uniref:tRNA-uridine aminocarboxypropyltransferase n=1 Tax=Rugamonas sp. CCM 8940 TaxID=2765359 RepID=UPI0018F395E1|nr:tRNA-uridine aminocarboxypropyltransferase [Rugamonas sp. CCM 8940]MBJ7310773.1 DTW domain-containing protein [Rugamonas sp. CCM 8940]
MSHAAESHPLPRARRVLCDRCQRPQQTCICHWVTALPNLVDVLLLQHPLEVANAKGSARLLDLCLQRSAMVVGETFAPEALLALLQSDRRRAVLLYPDTADERSLGIPPPPPFDPEWMGEPQRLRLVVLDGTWRKSRKMLYLNPLLQQLPRLQLRDTPPSHYLIRKAHLPDQLSTLEASCYALAQLEGAPHRYDPLIAAFDGFVAQQQGYVPPRVVTATAP